MSMMMPGGRTAHSRFRLPLTIHSTSTCNISKRSNLTKLIRQARLLIWDETTMAHRYAFEALDRTLRDITDVDLPFGGKIFLLGGDFRQVLPVVKHGTRAETVDACITNSYLWAHVQPLYLTENMRARLDPTFSDLLLRIGSGSEPNVIDDMIQIPDSIAIPWAGDHSLANLMEAIFPDIHRNAHDKIYISQRALITPRNDSVDLLNSEVIKKFSGDEKIYYSFDSVDNDMLNLWPLEFLNSLTPAGIPPHKLTLKLGAPLILLRNLDPKNGLCNGTRLLCKAFHANLLDVEILTGNFLGTRVFIPRIPLSHIDDLRYPFSLTRKQFPVRLSFAMTINKAQGQTIPHVGVYLPDHVFSHGQLYVALSRGTSSNTTKILVKKGLIGNFNATFTRNVVYTEVLQLSNASTIS